MKYFILYGETLPVWEREFHSWKEASAFLKRCADLGDIVFRFERIRKPGRGA